MFLPILIGRVHGQGVHSSPLGRIGPHPFMDQQLLLSPDGRRTAFLDIEAGGLRSRVVCDGIRGNAFKAIDCLVFSPDGHRLGYRAWTDTSTMVACIDGSIGQAFRGIDSIHFSADGKSFAYRVWLDSGMAVVLDGILGKTFTSVQDLCFSPSGAMCAYRAWLSEDSMVVVVNGQEGHHYSRIDTLRISSDGKHILYHVWVDEQMGCVVDGKFEGPFPVVNTFENAFLGNSMTPVYLISNDSSSAWVVNGTPWPLYPEVGYLMVNQSGALAVHTAREGDRQVLVCNGREVLHNIDLQFAVFSSRGDRYAVHSRKDSVSTLYLDGRPVHSGARVQAFGFSEDGRRFVFSVVDSGAAFLILDGIRSARYDSVSSIRFLPSSGRLVYTAFRDGKASLVLDGKPGKWYDTIAVQPRESKVGRRISYGVRIGKKLLMVVDGVEGPQHDGLGKPVFSRDGKHLAYAVLDGQRQAVVVDGKPRPGYDHVFDPIVTSDSVQIFDIARSGLFWRWVSPGEFSNASGLGFEPSGTLMFVGDAKSPTYLVEHAGKRHVVDREQSGRAYDMVMVPTIDTSHASVAYVAYNDDRWFVVARGIEAGPYDEIVTRLARDAGGKPDPVFHRERAGNSVRTRMSPTVPDLVYRDGLSFDENGDVVFVGLRRHDLCRIVIEMKPGVR
jgi:hypothetical protein